MRTIGPFWSCLRRGVCLIAQVPISAEHGVFEGALHIKEAGSEAEEHDANALLAGVRGEKGTHGPENHDGFA